MANSKLRFCTKIGANNNHNRRPIMKNILKKLFIFALIACLALSALAGCETPKGDEPPEKLPLTQAEMNTKSTEAIMSAGMGMLVGGKNTQATASIVIGAGETQLFALKDLSLKIKGSAGTSLTDIDVYFGGKLSATGIPESAFALTLSDGVLFVDAAGAKIKANSADINSAFATIFSLIANLGDVEKAVKSLAVGGDVSLESLIGDCTYAEVSGAVSITLPILLEPFSAELKGMSVNIAVTLKKVGDAYTFGKILINQIVMGMNLKADVTFITPDATEIAPPADAAEYLDYSGLFGVIDTDLVNAILATIQKQSFELSGKVDFKQITKNSAGEEVGTVYPLLNLDLKAKIERALLGTKALINYEVGGFAALILPSCDIYIPMDGDSLVYLVETMNSPLGGDPVTTKKSMTSDDYITSLSSLSSLTSMMEVFGLNTTPNENILEMLAIIKSVEKTSSTNGKSLTIKLDMAKLLPKNVHASGATLFKEEWLRIEIGTNGLLKSLTGKIVFQQPDEYQDEDKDEKIFLSLDINISLDKTDGVTVIAPDGFNKSDYPLTPYVPEVVE